MRFWVTWSLRNNGRLSFSRLTFDLCLQRQVRHPFVHDLQDCWQTQRHVYISESDRDRWPNPTQIHSPFTSPHLFSPQNWQLGPRSTHSPTQTQLLQHDEQKKKRQRGSRRDFKIQGLLSLYPTFNRTFIKHPPALQPQSTTPSASCSFFDFFPLSSWAFTLFFQISHWLRKCDPLCLPLHPLQKENELAPENQMLNILWIITESHIFWTWNVEYMEVTTTNRWRSLQIF